MRQLLFTTIALFALSAMCGAAVATAQDPAAACATAILQQDPAAAARAAGEPASPATRARLQAALLPLVQRPAAMLAVAQAFAGEAEADQALLAGSAATLLLLGRADAIPGLQVWTDVADEDCRYAIETDDLVAVVLALRAAVLTRQQRGGNAGLFAEAASQLEVATVSRFGLWPARVTRFSAWERPKGLAEELHLRVLPCPPGRVTWTQLADLGATAAPAWQATLSPRGDVTLPPLPPGNWLLEVRSATPPWRGVRTIEVSELDGIALAAGGALVLAAFDRNGPAAATWQLRAGQRRLDGGSLRAAPAVVAWPPGSEHEPSKREVSLHGEAGDAWLDLAEERAGEVRRRDWVMHGMVDRPLYRPGETVQGRVVLRACSWSGDGATAVPSTTIAADQPLRVVVDLGVVGRHELAGRTDAHGVFAFTFAVPAEVQPDTWFDFSAVVPTADRKGEEQIGLGSLCGAAAFRRQAVRLRASGPEEVPPGTDAVEVVATVEWASGGPVGGVDVRVHVQADGARDLEENHELRTGDDGRVVVRAPFASIGAGRLKFDFEATGPDGHVERDSHWCSVVAPDHEPAADDDDPWRSRLSVALGPAVVGAPCRVTVRGGAPHQHGVLVAGRGTSARAQAVQFDAAGLLTADVPVLRLDWPALDVTVATRRHHDDARVPVALRTVRAPAIDVPANAAPGSDLAIRVVADAPQTVVTVAVVDERIFALGRDRTPDPDDALRPAMPWWGWGAGWAPPDATPQELVTSLLRRGRVPPIDSYMRDLSRSTWAGGSPGPADSLPGGLRADFRPTATFVTVVTDQDGAATVRFRLPSDLTRWRLTAVGIDPQGNGFVATRTLASSQPLAAEPVLPRGVRAGDAFALPINIDRAANATAPDDSVALTAALTGETMQVVDVPATLTVPAGRAVCTAANVRATAAGTAKLALGVALGEHTDRSERELAVGRDAIVRPLHAAALGTGEVAVPLPAGTSPDAGLTVDVLLGGAAAWRQLEAGLASYPHGCVEQTLSRLVPYFAAVRAAKARGETLPPMDADFRKRLYGGLQRLRDLQHYRDGFAFWPSGEVDAGMTALALHGLALLRDAGCDPATAGLRFDPNNGTLRTDTRLLTASEPKIDAAFVQSAELAVAIARWLPADSWRQRIARSLLAHLPALPPGLCARLGLTLHALGDVDGASKCLGRLAAADAPALPADGFPGEDPLAVQALLLELAAALGVDAAQTETRAANLLLACLQGRGSTYAHAMALAALSRVLPRTPDASTTVEVRCGDAVRTFELGGEALDVAHWRVPRAAPVTVRGPAGTTLLVRIATERTEPAPGHAAWQAPICVERELCAPRVRGTKWPRDDGGELEPLAGPPRAGHPLMLRVRVQSPVAMRFVVVECPLPAGFELTVRPDHVDRYDDRLVFTCDLAAGKPCTRAFELVPTIAGRVLWPPATAAPMYVADLDGGTAGGFVTVVAPPAGGVPSRIACFTNLPPPPPPREVDPLEEFEDALDDAWDADEHDEATRRSKVEALLANVPPVPDRERERWLRRLTYLVTHLDAPRLDAAQPEAEWRLPAFARLQALLCEATFAAFAVPADSRTEAAEWQCRALASAIAAWPHDANQERALARVLARARATAPVCLDDVLGCVSTPVHEAALCFELRACLADPDRNVRWRAFAALPAQERANLPPALVIGAQHEQFDEGVITLLATSDAGRAELRARLRDPDFVLPQRARLATELPAELWRELTLPVLEAIAGVAHDDDERFGPTGLANLLAEGPFAVADLQRAMATAVMPAWRAIVARSLRQRAVTTAAPAVIPGDARWPFWCRALALGPDDATAAQAVLDDLARQPSAGELDVEPELLAAFAAAPIVSAGTPAQLYASRAAMTETTWLAAWTRLDANARVALLDLFKKRIGTTFVPATAAEAEAIWRFLRRGGEVDGAVDSMTRSAAGVACLRGHLLAGEGGTSAQAIRAEFAEKLALDATTLQPVPGKEWQALLTRVRRCGLDGEWTADELARLSAVQTLRGVGPAAGR
ncbi:MAG TPA: alpha-2-macroglobulin family protein [Planctomycetota bacterium]|nr:alpha-2-macroglobulin family protein [Planctomycetota bacterium]